VFYAFKYDQQTYPYTCFVYVQNNFSSFTRDD